MQMQMNQNFLDDRPFVDEADNLHLAAAEKKRTSMISIVKGKTEISR
jgi:hypothetical protein